MGSRTGRCSHRQPITFFHAGLEQLEAYVKWFYRLRKRLDDGSTLLQHLQVVERVTKKTPLELQQPEYPSPMTIWWELFQDLTASRSLGFSGPNPLSFQEVRAYQELVGIKLSVLAVQAIFRLDSAFLEVSYEDRKKEK